MTSLLYRLGRGAAGHPWRAFAGWVAFTALVLGLGAGFGGDTQDDWNIPGAQAQAGLDLLHEHVPGAGNAYARVVVHTDEGTLPVADLQAPAQRPRGHAARRHRRQARAVRRR